jgi:nickel transport protein
MSAYRSVALVWLGALLAAPATGRAHDLWLEPGPGGLAVQYGHHPQLVSHGGETRIPYAPEVVRSALCLDAAGRQQPARLAGTYPVRVEGDCTAAYVLTSSGYWTKTTAGTKNLKKTEATAPLNAWQSFESVKHVAAWSPAAAEPLGVPLEIIPAENPLALHDGEKLTVSVLANGRPVADAVVTYDGKPRGETDSAGAVNVRIRHGGLQLIQATVRSPHSGPEADEVVHTTALTFALGAGQ